MMTLFGICVLGVFIVGAAIAFLSFNKREFQMTIIGLFIACIPLVMTYNLYQDKIAENAKYEARR